MDPIMGVAIYILIWWIAFFMLLPAGVQNHDEANVETPRGVERAAPARPMIWIKAIWAAGIALVLWLGVFWAVQSDLFGIRG
ncbi:MAG: DUF1467 family protein [Hyphomonadaceae bacterium]